MRAYISFEKKDTVNIKRVDKPDISLMTDLCERVVERSNMGKVDLKSLADHFSSLS